MDAARDAGVDGVGVGYFLRDPSVFMPVPVDILCLWCCC